MYMKWLNKSQFYLVELQNYSHQEEDEFIMTAYYNTIIQIIFFIKRSHPHSIKCFHVSNANVNNS
jgi:hypothetical protein